MRRAVMKPVVAARTHGSGARRDRTLDRRTVRVRRTRVVPLGARSRSVRSPENSPGPRRRRAAVGLGQRPAVAADGRAHRKDGERCSFRPSPCANHVPIVPPLARQSYSARSKHRGGFLERLRALSERKGPRAALFGHHWRDWVRKWVLRICDASVFHR